MTQEQHKIFLDLLEWFKNSELLTSLFFGVTGSGKTCVILNLCSKVIEENKQVIYMVPEISLIPQAVSVFSSFFKNEIEKNSDFLTIIHGGLSEKTRASNWLNIKKGISRITIGTRSAVFSPFDSLGLLVIDEEQESTYKSENTIHFHAREVAQKRCKIEGSKLLLVSATPSVESYYLAKIGKYGFNILKNRYNALISPKIKTIDTGRDFSFIKEGSCLSKELTDKINNILNKNEQVMLFLDRRGYNTLIRCLNCSSVLMCIYCSIPLIFHKKTNMAKCHCCGFKKNMYKNCPYCFHEKLVFSGFGIQKLEEEIYKKIENAKILRIDADSIEKRISIKKKDFEQKFKDFNKQKFNIMIGTRMISKGHNFKNVTLMGIVCFDQMLYESDFRGNEKVFSLALQTIGRVGRGCKNGEVFIQTSTPNHKIIEFILTQDYDFFFENEINFRKTFIYPPFCDIYQIEFIGKDEKKTEHCSRVFSEILVKVAKKSKDLPLRILNPTPAFTKKMSSNFRFKIIIKCKYKKNINLFLKEVFAIYYKYDKISKKDFSSVKVILDFNPISLF